jgi:hypothetical protein
MLEAARGHLVGLVMVEISKGRQGVGTSKAAAQHWITVFHMARVVYTVTYWHGMHYVPADRRRFVGTKFRCKGRMDRGSVANEAPRRERDRPSTIEKHRE